MVRISRFHKLDIEERRKIFGKLTQTSPRDFEALFCPIYVFMRKYDYLNKMTENVIAEYGNALSVVWGMQINGDFRDIPLVTEETTVIAAISRIAKLSQVYSFSATADDPVLRSHISIYVASKKQQDEITKILQEDIVAIENVMREQMVNMVKRGGGLIKSEIRYTENYIHIFFTVNVADSMGANKVTQSANKVSKYLKVKHGIHTLVEIVSNSIPDRCASAQLRIPVSEMGFKDLSGEEMCNRLCKIHALADECRERETTHHKGFMNGLSAILTATGQDDRANWVGIMDYLKYEDVNLLTRFFIDNSTFVAQIKLPVIVGIVGSPIAHHQSRFLLKKLLKIKSGKDLAQICACVSLASTFAACTSLVSKDFHDSYDKYDNRRK